MWLISTAVFAQVLFVQLAHPFTQIIQMLFNHVFLLILPVNQIKHYYYAFLIKLK